MAVRRLTIAMSHVLKRIFDILFSLTALIVLSPVFLLLAAAVKLTSPGPVIFMQIRVGRFGRHFRFYKFRSMHHDADALKIQLMKRHRTAGNVTFKLKDDPRLTRIGRFIRRTSLDELPQFFNVLFGDMSLVGPRPPLPDEVRQYTLEDRKRLHVKPGLTCLWQIRGRSDIPFARQVQLDKEYIRFRSLRQDLLILFRTVPAILTGRGAY